MSHSTRVKTVSLCTNACPVILEWPLGQTQSPFFRVLNFEPNPGKGFVHRKAFFNSVVGGRKAQRVARNALSAQSLLFAPSFVARLATSQRARVQLQLTVQSAEAAQAIEESSAKVVLAQPDRL